MTLLQKPAISQVTYRPRFVSNIRETPVPRSEVPVAPGAKLLQRPPTPGAVYCIGCCGWVVRAADQSIPCGH